MEKKMLVCTVGLPKSGKTTWSLEQGCPIVSPDAIRLALHGERFLPPAEPLVWTLVEYMILALFEAGHETVILDSTNNTQKRRKVWKDFANKTKKYDVLIHFEFIRTPKAVCIHRARKEKDKIIIPIIERQDAERDWKTLNEVTNYG